MAGSLYTGHVHASKRTQGHRTEDVRSSDKNRSEKSRKVDERIMSRVYGAVRQNILTEGLRIHVYL